jgi:outer membrane protein OmpA-like peptidoglycan-associated protein
MSHVSSMTPDLMGLVTREITPDVVRNAAAQLGEDRERTASALSASVPSVLAAFSDVASSEHGAEHLKEVIDDNRRTAPQRSGETVFRSAATASSGPAPALLDEELGPRTSSIADAVARTSGIKRDSARQLLGGVATVTVATLGRSVGSAGPASLRAMFLEQRGDWMKRLPGPVASLFNGASRAKLATAPSDARVYRTGPAIRELPTAHRPAWLLPLILAALAVIVIGLVRGFHHRALPPTHPQATQMQPPPQPQPPPPQAAAPQPQIQQPPAPQTAVPPTEQPQGAAPSEEPQAAAPAQPEEQPAAPAQPENAAPAQQAQPRAAMPTPMAAEATGSIDQLPTFLGSTEGTMPARFAMSAVTFANGSAKPSADSAASIDQLGTTLRDHPNATVTVEGYADSMGSPQANQALSQARADAVKSMLVQNGVDESRIDTAGYGDQNPVAPNGTTAGRAENRRIDVVVTGR